MRDIEKAISDDDRLASLAFQMYEYRIRKYVGAYVAAMNGVDAIVFTAGIGRTPRPAHRPLRQFVLPGHRHR